MRGFYNQTVLEIYGNILRSFKQSRAGLLLIALVALPLISQAFPFQNNKVSDKKATPDLTEEEKEIIKDREILENLILLQNLDAIDYLDILNEMDPDWAEEGESAGREDNKEEGEIQ